MEGLRVLSRVSPNIRRQADALARIVDQFIKRSAEERQHRILSVAGEGPAGSLAFNRLCEFLFREKQFAIQSTSLPVLATHEDVHADKANGAGQ